MFFIKIEKIYTHLNAQIKNSFVNNNSRDIFLVHLNLKIPFQVSYKDHIFENKFLATKFSITHQNTFNHMHHLLIQWNFLFGFNIYFKFVLINTFWFDIKTSCTFHLPYIHFPFRVCDCNEQTSTIDQTWMHIYN